MAVDTTLQGRDIWMRSTDENGNATLSHHRVWDAERFVTARQRDAEKLNAEKKSTRASAQQITRDQYRQGAAA